MPRPKNGSIGADWLAPGSERKLADGEEPNADVSCKGTCFTGALSLAYSYHLLSLTQPITRRSLALIYEMRIVRTDQVFAVHNDVLRSSPSDDIRKCAHSMVPLAHSHRNNASHRPPPVPLATGPEKAKTDDSEPVPRAKEHLASSLPGPTTTHTHIKTTAQAEQWSVSFFFFSSGNAHAHLTDTDINPFITTAPILKTVI